MKSIIATENDHNVKLLKFLERNFRDVPHSVFRRILRNKDVKVNGKRVKDPNCIINKEDKVEIYGVESAAKKFSPINYDIKIIYKDKNILIVDKNKGVVVHGTNDSLDNQVKSYLLENKEWDFNDSFIPSHVHRLDKWTNGLIIYALNYESLREMNAIIAGKNMIKKVYEAKVEGQLKIDKKINGFIRENENGVLFNMKKGKPASTYLKTIKLNDKSTILECILYTGRKHQIRTTLKYLGHPIIGDNRYGNIKVGDLALTAKKITFSNIGGKLAYLNGKTIERS